MSDRSSWPTTTHDWSKGLDRDHLADVRGRLGEGDAAGGRRHLILEVLAYADEEAQSLGRVGEVSVTYHDDGSVTVSDDGRGTDTRTDNDRQGVRKPVMATPAVRFPAEVDAPRPPDGLPRGGMSTVAALSSDLVHVNHRRTGAWSQTYRYGVPDDELVAVEPRERSGTSISFTAPVAGASRLEDSDLEAFPWLRIVRQGARPLGRTS